MSAVKRVDFKKLRIGARVRIDNGPDMPPTSCEVMDKVCEHPGVQTVLVRIGSGARKNLRYVSAGDLMEERK